MILIALYSVFILAPAIVFYRVIFTRRDKIIMTKPNLDYIDFAPYRSKMLADYDYLTSKPCKPISIIADDGAKLYGVFYDAKSDKTALLVHGYNSSPATVFCLQARFFYDLGFNVAFIYHRGHGESQGVTTLGCKEKDDLIKWISYFKDTLKTKQILLYGLSMGSSVISLASPKIDSSIVKGLILDCGFSSVYGQLTREMEKRHLPVFLIGPLLIHWTRRYLNIDIKESAVDTLKRNKIPAIFLHGGKDLTVPEENGRNNYDACASKKTFIYSPDAPHAMCYPSMQDKCESEIKNFIKNNFE